MESGDNKEGRLLASLSHDTWVMLRPSTIAGIGVFAIRDIPTGCRDMFSKPDLPDQWISVPRAEVSALPEHARHLVETYCVYDETNYFVPANGFKKMDLACYLNHSDAPNVRSIDDGDYFEALRVIHADEELFVDYGTLVDGE